jgi:phytoene synthase
MNTSDIAERVIRIDFDRAISLHFAPRGKRHGLRLLLLFDQELVKIRHQVSDPLLRRIRIQFWREALGSKGGNGHVLARQLVGSFASDPQIIARLEDLLDVHERYVEDSVSFKTAWHENAERHSILFKLALMFLCPSDCAIQSGFFSHCGIAYGGSAHLCRWGGGGSQTNEQLKQFVQQAREAYESLLGDLGELPANVRPAVLPLALAMPYLDLFWQSDRNISRQIDLHPVKKVWMIWRAARTGFK